MGVEREDHGRSADPPGLRAEPCREFGMAAMDAVEIADRHGAAALRGRKLIEAAQKFHGWGGCRMVSNSRGESRIIGPTVVRVNRYNRLRRVDLARTARVSGRSHGPAIW